MELQLLNQKDAGSEDLQNPPRKSGIALELLLETLPLRKTKMSESAFTTHCVALTLKWLLPSDGHKMAISLLATAEATGPLPDIIGKVADQEVLFGEIT
ncbi:hypothetical protein BGZ58_005950, partial [Dissophora ornata]